MVKDFYVIQKVEGSKILWTIRRGTVGKPEHTRYVGVFQRQRDAKMALELIKKHPDRDFAEWVYTRTQFRCDSLVEHATIVSHLYKIWQSIHMEAGLDKIDVMDRIALLLAYTRGQYEEYIDSMQYAHAMEVRHI